MHSSTSRSERGRGVLYSTASYVLWGIVPLYYVLLVPLGAGEIVGWRVIFSMVLCLILVAATRAWKSVVAICRQPKLLGMLALSAAIIYANWYLFTIATTTGAVLEASLGYFITPIISVVLGVVFFHERLRPLQWAAFGLTGVAVLVLAAFYGKVPWMALAMAVTFGFYGFVKKKIGARVDAVSGMAIETAWTVPIAVIQLVVIGSTTGLEYGSLGTANTLLLPMSGIVTIVPLLLFAAGTRRVPMVYLGMLQFIEPMIQFLTGAIFLGEELPPERLLGFGIVWAAVALLVIDSLSALRSRARERRIGAAIPTLQTGPIQSVVGVPPDPGLANADLRVADRPRPGHPDADTAAPPGAGERSEAREER